MGRTCKCDMRKLNFYVCVVRGRGNDLGKRLLTRCGREEVRRLRCGARRSRRRRRRRAGLAEQVLPFGAPRAPNAASPPLRPHIFPPAHCTIIYQIPTTKRKTKKRSAPCKTLFNATITINYQLSAANFPLSTASLYFFFIPCIFIL